MKRKTMSKSFSERRTGAKTRSGAASSVVGVTMAAAPLRVLPAVRLSEKDFDNGYL